MTVVLCQHSLVRPLPAMDLVPPGAGTALAGGEGGGQEPPSCPLGETRAEGPGCLPPPAPCPEPWLASRRAENTGT